MYFLFVYTVCSFVHFVDSSIGRVNGQPFVVGKPLNPKPETVPQTLSREGFNKQPGATQGERAIGYDFGLGFRV